MLRRVFKAERDLNACLFNFFPCLHWFKSEIYSGNMTLFLLLISDIVLRIMLDLSQRLKPVPNSGFRK